MQTNILRLSEELLSRLDHCGSLDDLPDEIQAGTFLGPIECHRDPDSGWHSIATAPIPEGTIVSRMEGTRTDRAWRYSCQIGPDLHVLGPPYINHSCEDPNLWIDSENVLLIAYRDIAAGEELTLDYLTFETDMRNPFRCACGSPRCRGLIAGFDWASDEEKLRLSREFVLPSYFELPDLKTAER